MSADERCSVPVAWVRAPIVRVYDVADRMVAVGADGSARELSGASAELGRAVLAFATTARTRAEILAHVAEAAGSELSDAEVRVVDELTAVLAAQGALVHHAPPAPRPALVPRRLVLCVSGAVAAMHAPALVLLLQRRGFEVRIAMTETALRFVRAEALEVLVHGRVWSDMFAGHAEAELPVPHIQLARWAEVVLVSPASATTISRLATGDHGSLVAAIALTTRAPVVVVPSMNAGMFESPATERNVAQLIADGMHMVHPARGLEVADVPGARAPMLGPAPPHAVVVQLVETILGASDARRGTGPRAPRDAAEWEALYRDRSPGELPWHREGLDDDVAALLDAELGRARGPLALLDVGTGTGGAAIAAARRGFRVVATDVSATALERAGAAASAVSVGAASIVWLEDDITASRLRGSFEVLLDRGCFHLLGEHRALDYVAAVARLAAPGAALIVKTHAPELAREHGTAPWSAADLAALFHSAFSLEVERDSELPGPGGAAPARLYLLRRSL